MNNSDTMVSNNEVLYKAGKELEVENQVNRYEYTENDWRVICDFLGLDPKETTDFRLTGNVLYIGDIRKDDYAKKMTIEEFIDTFGLATYVVAKELYSINDYADKTPIIVFREYDNFMESVEVFRKMLGANTPVYDIFNKESIIRNIIKVIYE